MSNDSEPQTIDGCKFRSRIIAGLMVLVVGSVGYATITATIATSAVESHKDVLVEVVRRLDDSLDAIQDEQKYQRGVLEEIRNNGKGNGG